MLHFVLYQTQTLGEYNMITSLQLWQVWAAGFATALLKKRSSSANPIVEVAKVNGLESEVSASEVEEKEPGMIEIMLLSALEKLFSFLLNLPDVNQ